MTGRHGESDGPPLLADPADARSNCGVGVVMDLDGGRDHDIVADGLELLRNLEHRGTTGAEADTGDGAGVLLQTPRAFFEAVVDAELPERYAVGTLFLPRDGDAAAALRERTNAVLAEHGLEVVHWRDVPTDNADLGATALESEPDVWQCFVAPDGLDVDAFDRALYVGRRALERAVEAEAPAGAERFYVCSLDRRTVVYKGLLTSTQLADYYPDLRDDRVRSTFAMVHARFSTNTLGAWHLAHPYRGIVHNGEFNTIRGNVNWMRARETDLAHEAFGDDLETVKPVIADPEQSDTASVDNALELLLAGGRSLPHALRMLIPEAWRAPENRLGADREAFYDYHASLVEPWDGPALVVGTDGERVAAALDRNGLRPCRYERTVDNRLVLASEAGALDLDIEDVEERGRLQPGQLFLADPAAGRVVPDHEVFEGLTADRYAEWVDEQQVALDDLTGDAAGAAEPLDALRARQAAHGLTHDELDNLLEPMATDGRDPVGSMGDDTPLSVLSPYNRGLDSYFKQLFAQVSNPPIDNYRESLVMSLETRLGAQRNLLAETAAHANQLRLDSPVLDAAGARAVRELDAGGLSSTTIETTYDPDETSLEAAVEQLREAADAAADAGHDVLMLTDRGADDDRVPIPGLLATAAVHHHLVRNGRRNHVGLVVETGDVRTVHQLCTLVGYGAGAVYPSLAYATIEELVAGPDGADVGEAVAAYRGALEEGLLKVMSKMGISTVASYQGAQIFEAVGLDADFVAEYFEGTPNRTGGIGLAELEDDLLERHAAGFDADAELERQGEFAHRSTGIPHRWNPKTVGTLQQAVRNGDYERYREFAELVNDQTEQLQTLRGLLEFDDGREPVPLEEVEPEASILARFGSASMSLGSLSPEAHETLSIAMNRLGAKSGTGEGGEPPSRFGTERECNIKQVASGRFGVTASYLAAAEELQIKMAQGSKPGEGGHLPGHKVNEMIAEVRQSVPGVGLISPPPQHDIYSIEDLKQLIYDLKAANPDAAVNVKLVAEDGVGVIAAGCAKAKADVVHISGHSGGTGASPRTSIKNAGVPWELGLAEANQLLRATGLRSRVRLSTDGGLMTGRDAAVAAALGAEEFVFGTAGLVAEGCVMARQCHQNTCPVGVATQDPDLRGRFQGEPEHVMNYFRFIARELRELLAELGFRSVEELVGRVEVLRQRTDVTNPKARRVDLSRVLAEPDTDHPRTNTTTQEHDLEGRLDWSLIEAAEPALADGEPVRLDRAVSNRDRAVGATLSNRVVSRHGDDGLPDDTIRVAFDGVAGQSFGAFLAPGVTFDLEGGANDYLGKGLSGGTVVVRTPDRARFDPAENTVVGNVALYGATGGEVYVNGVAGERFAVRNSGVRAVVEGVGDHGCEYMTGGIVAVLGGTGKNFAAGMSGGIAYVHDPAGDFEERCNGEMVDVVRTLEDRDEAALRRLVENHAAYTGSDRAAELLDDWSAAREQFVKVLPEAYARAIGERPEADARLRLPASAAAGGRPSAGESAD
ncbi:MAG: glutamate synthase large subunit [Halobacteriales archaeon]|nr:glutamate synthase large subunit [Halobacteriales archaeon]